MQNWLKIESSKSSVVVLPTISPTALTAMRRSTAASSSVVVPRAARRWPRRGRAGAVERVLMPRVDHHLQHLGLDFARPDQFLDGVLQRFQSPARQAANVDDRECGGRSPGVDRGEGGLGAKSRFGEHQAPGQIHFVADQNAFLAGEFGQIILVVRRQRFASVEHVQNEFGLVAAFRGCGGCLRAQSRRAPRAIRRCQ